MWASAVCFVGALAAVELATQAIDDVHRFMFGTLAVALAAATIVLQIVRWTLSARTRRDPASSSAHSADGCGSCR